MKYSKPPISVSGQIQLLKDRGLHFGDEQKAAHYLSNISYYRLRAYTYPFQDNAVVDHPFDPDVFFEQIIELYVFDRQLRLLLFDAIEKIEIAFRTQIIYQFAMTNGSHWHIKPDLYRDVMRFANHLDSLQKEVGRSNEVFLDHYKNKYDDPSEPPCWMSLEVSSMGLLSKILQNLKRGPEKKAITKHFGLRDEGVLENWMLCISLLRNVCAHHGRAWNRRLTKIKLPTSPIHSFPDINKMYPNKLYASLCCIEYIFKIISPNTSLSERLQALMKSCPMKQEKEMGFPQGWEKEEIWQIR